VMSEHDGNVGAEAAMEKSSLSCGSYGILESWTIGDARRFV